MPENFHGTLTPVSPEAQQAVYYASLERRVGPYAAKRAAIKARVGNLFLVARVLETLARNPRHD